MTNVFLKLGRFSIALAFCVGPAAAEAACATTLASLNGWYGMLVTGATVGASSVPKYQAGALYFNGVGGLGANNVYTGAGVDSTATGAYSINTDCTVKVSLTLGSTTSVYTVAIKAPNEAVGIETDATAVATIDLQAQYATLVTTLNFTNSSLNGTFAANCTGPEGPYSDLNLATFLNGTLKGTDPYNNAGSFAVANVPYSGTYKVNTDGTFSGSLTVTGNAFDFYGVISNSGGKLEYIYSGVSSGAATAAFAACVGRAAAAIAF